MSKQAFSQFLQHANSRGTATSQDEEIDWEAEKTLWLSHLNGLYDQVTSWTAEYTQSGQMRIIQDNVQLREPEIGPYAASVLRIWVGTIEVIMMPIGTAVVGTKGRVDLQGPAGIIRLVLGGKNWTHPQLVYRQRKYGSATRKAAALQSVADVGVRDEEWTWKVSTNPPSIRYHDLTADTFFEALLKVLNG